MKKIIREVLGTICLVTIIICFIMFLGRIGSFEAGKITATAFLLSLLPVFAVAYTAYLGFRRLLYLEYMDRRRKRS